MQRNPCVLGGGTRLSTEIQELGILTSMRWMQKAKKYRGHIMDLKDNKNVKPKITDHESGFLRFIDAKQARRLGVLLKKGDKGRKKAISMLPHHIKLLPEFSCIIQVKKQNVNDIYGILCALGAPETCYILSEDTELDGAEFLLTRGLESIVGKGFGSFLSCRPGRLGYFEYEDANQRYILHRP